jgi:hypothetical protein
MKTIFTLLALILSVTSAHADITAVGQQKIQSIELLTNPGFENGKARWTNVGGTFSIVTSGSNFLGIGKSSATWQASGSGQYLESETVTVPVALQGKACGASFQTFGGDGNLQLQAYDNSNNALGAALTLQAQTVATPAVITFRCPSSGGVKYRLQSTAASALIALDAGHLGDQGTYQIQQAQLVGQIKITGCASNWGTTSTTLADFTPQTGCVYTALSGSAQAPSTMIPGIKFASLQPGSYILKYEGTVGLNYNSGYTTAYFQFWDGTNSANETPAPLQGAGSGNSGVQIPGFQQTISYSNVQSNVTLSIRAATSSTAGAGLLFGTTSNPGVISVYYFPTQSQTAYRADQTPASWSGTSTQSGTTASTTAADPSSVVGSITPGASVNMNCTAASGLVGITCNLPRAGIYKVCYGGYISNNGVNTGAAALYDGSNNMIAGTQTYTSGGANYSGPVGQCGDYSATAAGTATFKLRGYAISGTETVTAATWSVLELTAPMAMPFVLNQVNSNNSNGERVERAIINSGTAGTACTTSPCTVYAQSGSWISSVTRTSTGNYTINFAAGMFSGTPTCTASGAFALNSTFAFIGTQSSSSVAIASFNAASAAAADSAWNLICMGPK